MNNFYNRVHLSGFYNTRKVENAAKKGHELVFTANSTKKPVRTSLKSAGEVAVTETAQHLHLLSRTPGNFPSRLGKVGKGEK